MAIDLTDPNRYGDFIQKFREWDMKLRKAIDLMHEGSLLMQMSKSGDTKAWYLVPGGEITDDIAKSLMAMPNVSEGNDGLFPGMSQTWKIRG